MPTFVSANAAGGIPGSSRTLSFTVSGGTDRLLAIFATQTGALESITGATYNGIAMTANAQAVVGGIRNYRLFHLAAPTTGTHDAVVTYAGSCTPVFLIAEWTGVHQTVPVSNVINADNAANQFLLSWPGSSSAGYLAAMATTGGGSEDFVAWTSPASELLHQKTNIDGAIGAITVAGETSISVSVTGTTTGTCRGTAFNINSPGTVAPKALILRMMMERNNA